jgi:hypothetical protein
LRQLALTKPDSAEQSVLLRTYFGSTIRVCETIMYI